MIWCNFLGMLTVTAHIYIYDIKLPAMSEKP